MSDLGSEELEEEGENDLGVRAPDQGGTSEGCVAAPEREAWGPEGQEAGDRTKPATLAALRPGSRSER